MYSRSKTGAYIVLKARGKNLGRNFFELRISGRVIEEMVGVTLIVLSATSFLVSWHQPAVSLRQPLAQGRVGIGPCAALDMKDPDVAKEYAAVMAFDTEKIVDELEASGIRPPPTMSAFG